MIGADVFISTLMSIKEIDFDVAEDIIKNELNVDKHQDDADKLESVINVSDHIREILHDKNDEIVVKIENRKQDQNNMPLSMLSDDEISQIYDLQNEEHEDETREIRISRKELNEIIENSCYSLIEDLSRVLDYFRYENSSFEIVRLYLTGGGSFIKGLKESIELSLGFEVVIVEDFRTVQIDKKNTDLALNVNSYLTAIGASL